LKNKLKEEVLTLYPYWDEDEQAWLFDDESVELFREPFVNGIPEMIDKLVSNIPDAKKGFKLLFSSKPFFEYQVKLTRDEEEYGGTWYKDLNSNEKGWLCPALFKYFKKAPPHLFVKAKSKHVS
jgi:hypothetical protein